MIPGDSPEAASGEAAADGKKTEDVIRYLNLDSATRVSTSYSYSYSEEKLRISITLSRL